jgi:DNA-binding NarL/FixJ family response regulator
MRVVPLVSGDEALQVLPSMPDLEAVVIDAEQSPSSMSGLELVRTIRDKHNVGVLVVSGQAAPEVDNLPSGVYFLAKPFHHATLVQLVRDLVQGGRRRDKPPELQRTQEELTEALPDDAMDQRLTPRQHEVLGLLVQGKSNTDIAETLGISPNTVKVHLALIYRMLGVSSRTEAALAGLRLRHIQ